MQKDNFKTHMQQYFESISQALFFKHAMVGAGLLLISLLFKPELFVCGIFASLIGYIYSVVYSTPRIIKSTGLLTINGFFFGIAMASLFPPSLPFYICLLIGAVALPVVTKASFEVLQHWKITPLIFPYIISVWVLCLCANQLQLNPFPNEWAGDRYLLPSLFPASSVAMRLMWSMLIGMGRLFFLPNPYYGYAILILITVFSPRRGFYFLLGTLAATLVAYGVSGGGVAWEYGYFSYCAGLVGLGLAAMPEKYHWRTILLFCVISLFLTLAIDNLLKGVGVPVLSLPYVLTFWTALLSRVPRLNVNWTANDEYKGNQLWG